MLRHRRQNRPRALDELLALVAARVPTDECIPWMRSMNNGYGRVTVGDEPQYAHRVVFKAYGGTYADGDHSDHLCHTRDATCPGGECAHRACVNPTHIEAVTPGVNVLRGRGMQALALATGRCLRGHDLTDSANVYRDPRRPAHFRWCRACHRERSRATRARARQMSQPAASMV